MKKRINMNSLLIVFITIAMSSPIIAYAQDTLSMETIKKKKKGSIELTTSSSTQTTATES